MCAAALGSCASGLSSPCAIALGFGCVTALGSCATALGLCAIALGSYAIGIGSCATAMGAAIGVGCAITIGIGFVLGLGVDRGPCGGGLRELQSCGSWSAASNQTERALRRPSAHT